MASTNSKNCYFIAVVKIIQIVETQLDELTYRISEVKKTIYAALSLTKSAPKGINYNCC